MVAALQASSSPRENILAYDACASGAYQDAESGLHDNRFRTYDPGTGRYISADPIGQFGLTQEPGGLFAYASVFRELLVTALVPSEGNLYAYAGLNPIGRIDALGLASCTYSIGTHTMNCVPSNPNNQSFSSSNAVSGQNTPACPDCQNNAARTSVQDAGPIPAGTYDVGPQHQDSSRRDLTPQAGTNIDPRFGFQTHGCANANTCSQGCIGFTTNAARNAFNGLMAAEPNSTVTVQP